MKFTKKGYAFFTGLKLLVDNGIDGGGTITIKKDDFYNWFTFENKDTDAPTFNEILDEALEFQLTKNDPPKPQVEEPKAVEEKPKKEPKKKKITIETVRAALNDKAKKDGFNKALEILKDCGADNVTELQEQFYERCVELCQK